MHLKLYGGKENKALAPSFYRQDYKNIGSAFFILRIISSIS